MFNMQKKIKKWGNSLVIVFDKEDVERHGIVEGDWADLSDMLVEKNILSNSQNDKQRGEKAGEPSANKVEEACTQSDASTSSSSYSQEEQK